MAKPPRRVSEPGRDNHTWNDERAHLVRTRLAYLRTYSEHFEVRTAFKIEYRFRRHDGEWR